MAILCSPELRRNARGKRRKHSARFSPLSSHSEIINLPQGMQSEGGLRLLVLLPGTHKCINTWHEENIFLEKEMLYIPWIFAVTIGLYSY